MNRVVVLECLAADDGLVQGKGHPTSSTLARERPVPRPMLRHEADAAFVDDPGKG